MGNKSSKEKKNKKDTTSSPILDKVDDSDKLIKNHEVKISFVGNVGIGKTQYYRATWDYVENNSIQPYSCIRLTYVPNYGTVYTCLWELSEHETFNAVTACLIKKCNIVMLLYAIDNKESFNNLESLWIGNINSLIDLEKQSVILIGYNIHLAMDFYENGKVTG